MAFMQTNYIILSEVTSVRFQPGTFSFLPTEDSNYQYCKSLLFNLINFNVCFLRSLLFFKNY